MNVIMYVMWSWDSEILQVFLDDIKTYESSFNLNGNMYGLGDYCYSSWV